MFFNIAKKAFSIGASASDNIFADCRGHNSGIVTLAFQSPSIISISCFINQSSADIVEALTEIDDLTLKTSMDHTVAYRFPLNQNRMGVFR